MTPREQLIQEIFQAPDSLIDVLLKLLRLGQAGDTSSVQELQQDLTQQLARIVDQQDLSTLSAYDLAKDLAGCVEGSPTDLSTNPDHMKGFGS